MVRLISRENSALLGDIVKVFFAFQRNFTHIVNVNKPEVGPCIYALWHGNQCSIFGLPDKNKINVMISNSSDGDAIDAGVKFLGFKTVRASTGRRGNVSGTKQLIEALRNGEYGAMMVDGPRGPIKKAKGGIVKIAKAANVPIVPLCWYSNQFNFIKLNTWDNFSVPVFGTKLINLFGEPIYVNPESPDEDDKNIIAKIQTSLDDLDKRIPEEFKEAKKKRLWANKENLVHSK